MSIFGIQHQGLYYKAFHGRYQFRSVESGVNTMAKITLSKFF